VSKARNINPSMQKTGTLHLVLSEYREIRNDSTCAPHPNEIDSENRGRPTCVRIKDIKAVL